GLHLGEVDFDAEIKKAVVSPDSRWLMVEDANGRVRLWSLTRDPAPGPIVVRDGGSKLSAIQWSPDSRWVVLRPNFAEGQVVAVDSEPHSIPVPAADAVAFSDDSQLLAAGGRDKTIRLWALKSATLDANAVTVRKNPDPIAALHFAAGGKYLVATGWDPFRKGPTPGVCLWKAQPLANDCIDLDIRDQ